jgi:hypothetical protein
MWDRAKVIDIGVKYNGLTRKEAGGLLWKFSSGNTIANEGCLITCLSMVLKLLHRDNWTPGRLNEFAHKQLYYTPSGLSMATLYADLVGEASDGKVQLFIKEEYHSGHADYQKVYPSNCLPLQGYLSLSTEEKSRCIVMLKIGSYDDTFASHFILVDPEKAVPNEDNIAVLDPIKPFRSKQKWSLSDSCKCFCQEKEVRTEWKNQGISPLQIAGVWVFCRWQPDTQKVLGEPLLTAISTLLNTNKS